MILITLGELRIFHSCKPYYILLPFSLGLKRKKKLRMITGIENTDLTKPLSSEQERNSPSMETDHDKDTEQENKMASQPVSVA